MKIECWKLSLAAMVLTTGIKMKKFLFTLIALTFSTSVYSAILQVESMSINGGQVSLNGEDPYELLIGDIGPIYMGQYQGSSACCSPEAARTSLVYYEFGFFGWVGIHTTQFDELSNQALAPSAFINTENQSIHVDLGSWAWSWNGHNYHQGASEIIGTYDETTETYNINWSSVFPGGPFDSQIHDWNLTGIASVSAIPIPAAIWLFGSGLISLVGFARRNKYKN